MSARPIKVDVPEPANEPEWPLLSDWRVLLVLAIVIVATIGACVAFIPPMGVGLEFVR